jgi:arginase
VTGVRPLSVIGVPSSVGAYGPGQERAPSAFRRYGLLDRLAATGIEVVDRGDSDVMPWRRDDRNPRASNADLVARVAAELADRVSGALTDDHDVLVLGGDCTIELGTVAGANRDGSQVGLAYVDLDADLNTPETGDGILDWMGVAHLLGVEGAHDAVASVDGRRPLLDPWYVRLLAVANITSAEQDVIDRLGLVVEGLDTLEQDPDAVLARTGEWALGLDRLLVHVDMDVLDYDAFPIAENTDRRGGLSLPKLGALLRVLCQLPNFRALTLTEINPEHAPDEAAAFDELISMLTAALAARTSRPPQRS